MPNPPEQPTSNRTTVAVMGNPNTGKTTLFNTLTGLQQRTGNFPGVTVEHKSGLLRLSDQEIDLIDLPGTYSLVAASPDELVATDVLLGQQKGMAQPSAVVVVIDAANIERNLYLVTQILECGLPTIVALNMHDLAAQKGILIDTDGLENRLGCRVVPTVATKGEGIEELRQALQASPAEARQIPSSVIQYPAAVEAELAPLEEFLSEHRSQIGRDVPRVEAVRALVNPDSQAEKRLLVLVGDPLRDLLHEMRQRIEQAGIDLLLLEPELRYGFIDVLARECVTYRDPELEAGPTISDRVDQVLTHAVGGTLVFLVLMGIVFQALYGWSGPFIDLIDNIFIRFGDLVGSVMPAGTLQSLVVDGIIAGVGAVVVFVPQIVILFGFIAILEDCGYMARAAFLMDKLMSWVGLSGRSFVPMLSSFACAVPGILSARVIENRRDRLATILIAPLMSCSARLPVYTVMIAAFIPAKALLGGWLGLQGLVLFSMYLLGLVIAVPVAWFLKKTLLRGETPPFVMEMPQYKWPDVRTVAYRMLGRGKEFLMRAGTIILAMTVVVWALAYFPRPADLKAQYASEEEAAGAYLRQSLLGKMGHAIEPVVRPLGWDWKIGMATLASFPAREVIIATLGTVYNLGDSADAESVSLREAMRAETWPDGRPIFTALVALSIMVFFALCCQCGATLTVMKRETGSWLWPLFTFAYMTTLAYVGALLVYQIGRGLLG